MRGPPRQIVICAGVLETWPQLQFRRGLGRTDGRVAVGMLLDHLGDTPQLLEHGLGQAGLGTVEAGVRVLLQIVEALEGVAVVPGIRAEEALVILRRVMQLAAGSLQALQLFGDAGQL